MFRYKTVAKRATAEQIIEKSRFLAHIAPVESREEAEAFITEIRAQYRDATHNVPAMVIGEKMQVQWASDDGEPQGTSGAPMVQMLVKEGYTNVVCVVTRYFGGIKLGTGGLVRAYTSSLKLALAEAGDAIVQDVFLLKAEVDYTFLAKIQAAAPVAGFEIRDISYEGKPVLTFACEPEKEAALRGLLDGVCSGKWVLISTENTVAKI